MLNYLFSPSVVFVVFIEQQETGPDPSVSGGGNLQGGAGGFRRSCSAGGPLKPREAGCARWRRSRTRRKARIGGTGSDAPADSLG